MRKVLNDRADLQIFSEYLDSTRLPGEESEETLRRYLQARFIRTPPDAIVAVGDPSLLFVERRRAEFFPSTPLVYLALTEAVRERVARNENAAGIFTVRRLAPTIELARKLVPAARRIILISGTSEVDRVWEPLIKEERERLGTAVEIENWAGRSLPEIYSQLALLTKDSVAIYLGYLRDPAGNPTSAMQVAREVAAHSAVPVFGVYETHIGSGIVGGNVLDFTAFGERAGEIVLQILNGRSARELGEVRPPPARMMADAVALRRWSISPSALPPGTEIISAELPFWQDHPYVTATASAAVVLQSAVIGALVWQRRRRRRAETALRLSEQVYKDVVESQTEMVCRFLPDTTLTFVNEAYCRFFGADRAKLVGKPFIDLVPEAERTRVLEHVNRIVEAKRAVQTEHPVLRQNGEVAWMEWTDVPVMDERRKIVECQGIGRDVTERRQAVEARIDAERKLAHATRLSLLGELTASFAHQLNQPLGAIFCNAEAGELLLDAGRLDEVRAVLADIRRDDLRASKLIEQIRTVVKPREIEASCISVEEMVRGTLALIGYDAQRRGVKINFEVIGKLEPVWADRMQLEQVLLNVLINAMEAMTGNPKDSRLIRITAAPGGKSDIVIRIQDTGPGIQIEQQSSIFESFFTTKTQGMGLGLALARSIMDAHGGSISVENAAQGGAVFRLRLPVAPERIMTEI